MTETQKADIQKRVTEAYIPGEMEAWSESDGWTLQTAGGSQVAFFPTDTSGEGDYEKYNKQQFAQIEFARHAAKDVRGLLEWSHTLETVICQGLYFEENLRLRQIIDAMTDAMDNVSILTPVNDDGWRECIFCGHSWRVSRGEQHFDDCALSLAKKAMQDPNLALGGQG